MFTVRPATAADVDAFTAHRLAIHREMHGLPDGPEAAALAERTRAAFAQMLASRSTRVWLAADANEAVGSAALHVFERFPSLANPCAAEAYVSHVYVAPAHRRRGVATALLGAVVGEARTLGLARMRLHATEPGRALYETLGFRLRSNDMELRL